MYFIFLFVVSWLIFLLFADKSRLRELYGAVIFTCFLGLLTDVIMVQYKLWDYKGWPQSLYSIPLSLNFGIYPVVSYLFLQHLSDKKSGTMLLGLWFSCGAILLEWVTIYTGHMQHHLWWNLWWSFAADNLIFYMMTSVYRFYGSTYGAPQKRTSS